MSGWIKVSREMIDHPYVGISKPARFAAWAWMLKEACWKETKIEIGGKPVTLKRGQFSHSLRFISEKTGLTFQQTRTFLDGLESRGMCSKTNTAGNTAQSVITICNYDKYQSGEDGVDTEDNTAITQQQHSDNTKKKKERNKEINKPPKSPLRDGEAIDVLSAVVPSEVAASFAAHRRDMKRPLTERAAKIIVGKLEGHRNAKAVIEDSIANGWQGVFPDKAKPAAMEREGAIW